PAHRGSRQERDPGGPRSGRGAPSRSEDVPLGRRAGGRHHPDGRPSRRLDPAGHHPSSPQREWGRIPLPLLNVWEERAFHPLVRGETMPRRPFRVAVTLLCTLVVAGVLAWSADEPEKPSKGPEELKGLKFRL